MGVGIHAAEPFGIDDFVEKGVKMGTRGAEVEGHKAIAVDKSGLRIALSIDGRGGLYVHAYVEGEGNAAFLGLHFFGCLGGTPKGVGFKKGSDGRASVEASGEAVHFGLEVVPTVAFFLYAGELFFLGKEPAFSRPDVGVDHAAFGFLFSKVVARIARGIVELAG